MSARARTRRRRASTPAALIAVLLALAVGLPLLAELVRYALPLVALGLVGAGVIALARRSPRATAAYQSTRKTRAGRPAAELLAQAQAAAQRGAADAAAAERARAQAAAQLDQAQAEAARLAAELGEARAELVDAKHERDEARESAMRAWDAAADAGADRDAEPCGECGSLLAYSHSPGCTRALGYRPPAEGRPSRAALLADPRSGVRPLLRPPG